MTLFKIIESMTTLKIIGSIIIGVVLMIMMYIIIKNPHIKLNSAEFQIILLGFMVCTFLYVMFFSKFTIEINLPILIILGVMILLMLNKIVNMID